MFFWIPQREEAICYFVEKAEAAETRLKALEERLGLASSQDGDDTPDLDRPRSESFSASDAGLSAYGEKSLAGSPGPKVCI